MAKPSRGNTSAFNARPLSSARHCCNAIRTQEVPQGKAGSGRSNTPATLRYGGDTAGTLGTDRTHGSAFSVDLDGWNQPDRLGGGARRPIDPRHTYFCALTGPPSLEPGADIVLECTLHAVSDRIILGRPALPAADCATFGVPVGWLRLCVTMAWWSDSALRILMLPARPAIADQSERFQSR